MKKITKNYSEQLQTISTFVCEVESQCELAISNRTLGEEMSGGSRSVIALVLIKQDKKTLGFSELENPSALCTAKNRLTHNN